MTNIEYPSNLTKTSSEKSTYDRLGGEEVLYLLTVKFYEIMNSQDSFKVLRNLHGNNLEIARERLFWFLSGWLGGPALYHEKVGQPMLRARHLPFKIGIFERNQWLLCMHQAMCEIGIEEQLKDELIQSFFKTADWMRNN
jgi:hemoglobin